MFDSMLQFNLLDVIAIVVFLICLAMGIRRGFLQMTFSFLSVLIAIFTARGLYAHVSLFLRENTGIYEALKDRIISALGLSDIIENYIQQGEEAILSRLPLSSILIDKLNENNIPSVRSALSAVTLEDYIGSFLANIGLNILSAILVFILVMIIMHLAASVLKIIAKLPIIRTFDKAGGALVGALIGFIAVWALVSINLLLSEDMVSSSYIGRFLSDSGFLLRIFTDI